MKNALLRLAAIGLGVIVFFGLIVAAVNIIGESTAYEALDHPLVFPAPNTEELANRKRRPPSFASKYFLFNPENYADSLEFHTSKSAEKTNSIKSYLIDVVHANNEFWVRRPGDEKNKISLSEFLQKNPQETLSIKVFGSLDGAAENLVKIIDSFGLGERVIVFSERAAPLKELRKFAPRWLYAAHQNSKIKASILSNLFLEALASLDFDVFAISSEQIHSFSNQRLLAELKRRKKIVLLSTDSAVDESDPYALTNVDGIIVSRHGAQDSF